MSLVVVAAGSAIVAVGAAAYGGVAQSQAASYSAKVAKINQKQAGLQADEAEAAGRSQVDSIRLRTSALIAQATAAEAANGLQVGTGTPVEIVGDIGKAGAVDVAKSEYNTALTKWGYVSQATAFENQAKLDTSQATQALISGSLSAVGSLLGSAAKYNTNVMGQPSGAGDPSVYQPSMDANGLISGGIRRSGSGNF